MVISRWRDLSEFATVGVFFEILEKAKAVNKNKVENRIMDKFLNGG